MPTALSSTQEKWRSNGGTLTLVSHRLFRGASNQIRKLATRRWLQSRYTDRTAQYYTKSLDELKQQFDAESIFFKFDDDCSGTLTVHELDALFKQYDIQLSLKQL